MVLRFLVTLSMEAVKVASDLIISAWHFVVISGWFCGRALRPRIGHASIGVVKCLRDMLHVLMPGLQQHHPLVHPL